MTTVKLRGIFDSLSMRIGEVGIIWWTIIASWLLFFFDNASGRQYTVWDTHHLGFVNFLYFGDALRSGSLPLWNPLIQSGVFHPNFFNAGNYTPFQWIFVALGYVVSPLLAYELMLQAAVLLGAIGFYLWLRENGCDKYVSLFGAHAFFLCTLMPIVGQVMFIFSLAALPWLLLFCQRILTNPARTGWASLLFGATLLASFMASGYPWMNVVDLAITSIFTCHLMWQRRKEKHSISLLAREAGRVLLFLASVGLMLLCYYLPGYLSMKFNYQGLLGDYLSPEPRLRSLSPTMSFAYHGLVEAWGSVIDPRILQNITNAAQIPMWSWGAGLVGFLALMYRKPEKDFFVSNLFWIGLVVFFVAYSSGTIADFTNKLPLFNANRWWNIGQYFAFTGLIFMAAMSLQRGISIDGVGLKSRYFALFAISTLIILAAISAPVLPVLFVLCALVLFHYLDGAKSEGRKQVAVVLLMWLNMAAFISMPVTMFGVNRAQEFINTDDPESYAARIESRERDVHIAENTRRIDTETEYVYDNEDWLLNKRSYNHGDNPLGSPLYWYLKNLPMTHNLVDVRPAAREEKYIQRKDFLSDNAYMEALVKDVRSNENMPSASRLMGHINQINTNFRWVLNSIDQEPNVARIKVTTNGAGYLIFNNNYFPGWQAWVDGEQSEIVKMNRVFMGVYLPELGEHTVVFRFSSASTVALLLFPTALMLIAALFLLVWGRKELGKLRHFLVGGVKASTLIMVKQGESK